MRERIAVSAKALAIWIAGVFSLLIGIVILLSFRGLGPNEWQLAGLSIAVVVLLGMIGSALSVPIFLAFRETDGRVTFVWQYPHKRIVRRYSPDEIPEPSVERWLDSDGDPHFTRRIIFDDGLEFVLANSVVATGIGKKDHGAREVCEKACADFSDAVSRPSGY